MSGIITHKDVDSIRWNISYKQADEVEFYYLLLHSSAGFVRCALIDS